MKVTIELELVANEVDDILNDTELRAEIHQDMEMSILRTGTTNALYGAQILEVHLENKG